MNKQELIKKITGSPRGWLPTIENIINEVDREGWLRNPGEPIDPEDIREGDRLRRVRTRGSVGETEETEYTVPPGEWSGLSGCKYFLLDRPQPKPTNAEHLRSLVGMAPASLNREALADWLDTRGVKAPGGDDEH